MHFSFYIALNTRLIIMSKLIVTIFISLSFIFLFTATVAAQGVSPYTDSFFLAKKKGILGRIGRSVNVKGEYVVPAKTVNPYKKYHGKVIRSITVRPVGFNYNLNDTSPIRKNLAVKIANGLHLNTFNEVIRKNLFFKEGQLFYPLVVADNERFLREQEFLRDALIQVVPSVYGKDSVDVIVLTRDVFSMGGSFNASSFNRVGIELTEENIGGSGNRLTLFGLYDKERSPTYGYGAAYKKRNIKGYFLDWTTGFTTYNKTFNSGRREELNLYTALEKPMVSRYTAITGATALSYHSTINGYLTDSLYLSDFRYRFLNADIWLGYNFGYKKGKKKDIENKLRHFVAIRGFYNYFLEVPVKYVTDYNYRYADINGFLMAYSIYKQNFYRTNFIYGFGRNEDVPEGLNASLITGYTNKQGIRRVYYGVEVDASRFNKKGSLFSYTFKTGGYVNKKALQDIDLLLAMKHFTRLHTLNNYWYNRNYFDLSYTRQLNLFLNEPLLLDSEFGLPYFRNGHTEGSMRTTLKFESVFYNMKKILGFRLAPFVFTDMSLIQPLHQSLKKTNGYQALGGGLRTRNENLVFGTMELRGYIFPRVTEGAKNWKVELSTKLQFKYNSSFIRRPDFIKPN
jgi:hypothetical protein